MKVLKQMFAVCVLGAACSVAAVEIQELKNGVCITAPSLSLTVRDGVISDVSGFGDPGRMNLPAGLGILKNVSLLRSGHIPWGEPALNQELAPDFPFVNYFVPCGQSIFVAKREGNGAALSWKGLSNGREFLKDAVLKMSFKAGPDGRISVTASGSYEGGGVFGIAIPVTGSGAKSAVVPSLGGMRYDLRGKPGILAFGRPPYLEAPLAILEKDGGTLGMWMEDPTSRPHHLFVARSGKGFGAVLELNALMPFETKTEISAPPVHINVFPGSWNKAAEPYRNWYSGHYAREMAVRDSIAWARGIQVITGVDTMAVTAGELEFISKLFGRDRVMLMVWNARKSGWDCDLPDWTPRKGYREGVKAARKSGIRTMAYVNICCVNYLSPVWRKDGLDRIFLTRKDSVYQYKGVRKDVGSANSLNIGGGNYMDGPDLLKNIRPGSLLYGDLLSAGWRKYHAQMMKRWHEETGTDANYEDTAGTANDHGNGVVGGLSAGQGDTEQMRLLLRTNPDIPMAAEFAPASVAFAVTWPLNYPSVYGNDAFRDYRSRHQIPLSAFLFGYRQWITDSRGFSDALRYVQSAVADAVGGFGFVPLFYYRGKSWADVDADRTFAGLLHRRAMLFSEKQLQPYFPENGYPENVVCMYRGTDGIYSYRDNGSLQEMTGPDGKAVYGRVNCAFKAETALSPEHWPFRSPGKIFALNPKRYYPLFPRQSTAVLYAESLPEGVYLRRYFETAGAVYLELDSDDVSIRHIEADIRSRIPFEECRLNGKNVKPGKMSAELPFRLVCFTGRASEPEVVSLAPCGSFNGKAVPFDSLPERFIGGGKMNLLKRRNSLIAIPLQVSKQGTALEATVCDVADIFTYPHDGTVFRLAVDGKILKEFDTTQGKEPKWTGDRKARREMFDLRVRKWTIPLDPYHGRNILLTIEADSRENMQGDNPAVGNLKIIQYHGTAVKEEVLP